MRLQYFENLAWEQNQRQQHEIMELQEAIDTLIASHAEEEATWQKEKATLARRLEESHRNLHLITPTPKQKEALTKLEIIAGLVARPNTKSNRKRIKEVLETTEIEGIIRIRRDHKEY